MWAGQMARRDGIVVPNQACEHYYVITDHMEDVGVDWPVIEDPKRHCYIRPEAGGLMVGLFEPHAATWKVHVKPIYVS